MPVAVAKLVWIALGVYATVGLIVALMLYGGLLRRIDAKAAAAPFAVKLLLAPGLIALWPLMLRRSFGARPKEDQI